MSSQERKTLSSISLFSLSGKAVVVTGAGSGLGKAIAEACAEAGAAVVCAGRSTAVSAVAIAIVNSGGTAIDVRMDVTNEDDVAQLMVRATDEFGSLDVVFCNAGTSDHYKPAHETTAAEWQHVLDANLTSVFQCAKHALRHMIPRQKGKIVTLASVWGQIASDTIPVPSYVAAKGGVISLTRELAIEYCSSGITANALSPGFFATNIGADKDLPADTIDQLVARAVSRTPIHRFMHPDEIKGPAVFLASEASNSINGHVLAVDGGLLAC